MTREQFETKVRQLEAFSRQNPAQYRQRIVLLALLGYLYIFFLLLIGLSFLAVGVILLCTGHLGFGGIKIGLAGLIISGMILRSLWVTIPAPEGYQIAPHQAPELFKLINRLTTNLKTPRVDRVLIRLEFNAAMAQRPRFGIFGGHQSYLLIGLPLMQALSPEQFTATLAHELGHLSGKHGKFGVRIYSLRQSWEQILECFSSRDGKSDWMQYPIEMFIKWYAPLFDAYTFALRRMNEYEADRYAVNAAGARAMTETLMRLPVHSQFVESKFWEPLHVKTVKQNSPPAQVSTDLKCLLSQGPDPDDARLWLETALREETDTTDTHPSLSDRLQAIREHIGERNASLLENIDPFSPVPVTAAQKFLGDSEAVLSAQLDQIFQNSVAESWKHENAKYLECMKVLEELNRKEATQPLSAEEKSQQLLLTYRYFEPEEILPLARRRAAEEPDNVQYRTGLGRTLLDMKDDEGIVHLEYAIEHERPTALDNLGALYTYYKSQGRLDEAQTIRKRYELLEELFEEAAQERDNFRQMQSFFAHGLDAELLMRIRQALGGQKVIGSVYLAKGNIQHLPEIPFYVMGIVFNKTWWNGMSDEQSAKHIAGIASIVGDIVDHDLDIRVINLKKHKNLLKVLSDTPGSLVFKRIQ